MILVLGLSSWTPWENKAKKLTGKVISKIKLLTTLRVPAKHSKVFFLDPGIDTFVRQCQYRIELQILLPQHGFNKLFYRNFKQI